MHRRGRRDLDYRYRQHGVAFSQPARCQLVSCGSSIDVKLLVHQPCLIRALLLPLMCAMAAENFEIPPAPPPSIGSMFSGMGGNAAALLLGEDASPAPGPAPAAKPSPPPAP
eukprot:SAG11_NODE_6661_length_1271_cov_1.705631_3_plen_111_part_01